MQEKAPEIASHITHPVTIAAFALVFAGFCFGSGAGRKETTACLDLGRRPHRLALGLAPVAASTFLQSRGVDRVRAIVLGSNQSPFEDAQVSSSTDGGPKKVESG